MEGNPSNKEAAGQDQEKISEVMTFDLDGRTFGIWPFNLSEILEWAGFVPVPKCPPFFEGIINSHGRVVSVVDAFKTGDAPATFFDRKRVAVLKNPEFMVGILVPAELEINFFSGEIVRAEGCSKNGIFKPVKFVSKGSTETLMILDADCLYRFLMDHLKGMTINI